MAVAFAAAALSHRGKAGKTGPGPVAITVLVVLGAGTLAAMLSIGMLLIPVDALLLAACIRASNLSTKTATHE